MSPSLAGPKGETLRPIRGSATTISRAFTPADGPFSVHAWIAGGAHGQVIVSQRCAKNWLVIDAAGTVFIDLQGNTREAQPLYSSITLPPAK